MMRPVTGHQSQSKVQLNRNRYNLFFPQSSGHDICNIIKRLPPFSADYMQKSANPENTQTEKFTKELFRRITNRPQHPSRYVLRVAHDTRSRDTVNQSQLIIIFLFTYPNTNTKTLSREKDIPVSLYRT